MTHKIIDNFLSPDAFIQVQSQMLSPGFPWYFTDYVAHSNDPEEVLNKNFYQLGNSIYYNNEAKTSAFGLMEGILIGLNAMVLIRIKANLQPVRNEIIQFPFHYDHEIFARNNIQYTVGIYYLNTNNGYTVLEDGTKIESIENRMVLLPGSMNHTGTSSTDNRRVLINFNFISAETPSLYL
jgi:hypothetical protein